MPTVLSNGALKNGSLMLTSPAALFAAGEVGVWYDPSDMYTLFQDAAGTTPVTAVEQPVGLMLDKSGNGKHASQSTAASRPVLSARVNLLLATDTLSTQSVTTVATTYTLSFSGAGSITLSGTKTGTYSAGTSSLAGVTAGTLTLTVSGTVTNADLRVSNDGVNIPAYQRVNTSTDYDTVGFPAYLRFDGVDDFMQVSSFTLPLIERFTLVGVSASGLTSSAYLGVVSVYPSSGNDYNSTAGYVLAVSNDTANNLGWDIAGSTSVSYRSADVSRGARQPPTVVCEDKATGAGYLRRNGTQVASDTSFTEFAASSTGGLLLGARWSSGAISPSERLNGRLYGVVLRGARATAAQIAAAETWMNLKTRAY